MNPYWGQDFFSFFLILLKRLTGRIPLGALVSDEVQLLVILGVVLALVLIGSLLTLKKMSMMANSLSHTTLVGIVIPCILFSHGSSLALDGTMIFVGALVSALLTTVLTESMRDILHLQEDAAIGYVFTMLFAVGIILVTLFTKNSHVGIELITGSLDALHVKDISLAWMTACCNLIFVTGFFFQWTVTAFDPAFAVSIAVPVRKFHYLLMFLTALSLISAFRVVGIFLVLSLVVGPPMIARQWTCRVCPLITLAIAIGFGCSILGVAISRHVLSYHLISLSTGSIIVSLVSLGYLISSVLTFTRKKGVMAR